MVVVNAALEKAGVSADKVNRGRNWKPGEHLAALIQYAKKRGAFYSTQNPQDLQPGNIYFIERNSSVPSDHAGIVKLVDSSFVYSIDGGQEINGAQAILAVKKPILPDGFLGKRQLKWRIDSEKLLGESSSSMDTAAIKSYLHQVEDDWEKTQKQAAIQLAESISGKAPPLPFPISDFRKERYDWRAWYLKQIDAWWLDDDVYDAARQWHSKQKHWAELLANQPKGQTPLPGTVSQQDSAASGGPPLGTVVLGVAALGAVAYLASQAKHVKRGRR